IEDVADRLPRRQLVDRSLQRSEPGLERIDHLVTTKYRAEKYPADAHAALSKPSRFFFTPQLCEIRHTGMNTAQSMAVRCTSCNAADLSGDPKGRASAAFSFASSVSLSPGPAMAGGPKKNLRKVRPGSASEEEPWTKASRLPPLNCGLASGRFIGVMVPVTPTSVSCCWATWTNLVSLACVGGTRISTWGLAPASIDFALAGSKGYGS